MAQQGDGQNKALPAGLLVFYDEAKGVRQPEVKVFNPSPGIEQDVNDWIAHEPGVVVHRVDWIPSGGLMGASVVYSKGHRGSHSLVLPAGPSGLGAAGGDVTIQRLGVTLMLIGVAVGVIALALFGIFYPDVWYGAEEATIDLDPDLAVKTTVLVGGIASLLGFTGIALVFRGRVMA